METEPEDLAVPSSRVNREMGLSIIATCRLCMEKNCMSMAPIFNNQLTVSIADKIASVTRLNVCKEDGLPTMVCSHCLRQLDAAFLFIERCTSSDMSLRFMFTQEGVTSTRVCREEVRPSLQPVTESDTQLLNSNELLTTGSLDEETATVQDAEIAQRFLEDYAALRFEMVKFEETSILEDWLTRNNSTMVNSVNRSIESVPQMPVESLDMQLLHTDPLQISSKIGFTHNNVSGIDGIRDNLHAICAIVARSNDSLNDSNRAIKAEPLEPSADAPNVQYSESLDLLDCTMPVLEIQTNWLEASKTEGNISTHSQDFPNLVAEIEAENIESDSTAKAVNTVQTPKSVTPANQKQSGPATEKFKCLCPTEYTNKRSLSKHIKFHEKQRKKNLHSQTIGQTSKSRKQLFKAKFASKSQGNRVISHQLNVHNNATAEKRPVSNEVESPHIQRTELFSVQQSRLSEQLSQLKRVLVVKINRLPDNYLSLINPVTPSKKQKVTKKYKCAICLKEYKDKWYLTSHIKDHQARTHPDERPFKCKQCGNTYKNVPALNAHIRQHNAKRIYECELCKKLFMRMVQLKHHVMTHSKIRPYMCQTCGKGFKDVYQLRTHLLTHSSERPFKCEKCFRAFKLESKLKEHLRMHDQPQKPKLWHRCVVCLSDFLTEQRLQDHLQIHKNKNTQVTESNKQFQLQSSSDCTVALAVKGKLQNASRTTTKDKCDKIKAKGERLNRLLKLKKNAGESDNWVCKVCALVCANKLHLDCHTKTHMNENHLKCMVCEKRFNSVKTLEVHKVLHGVSRPIYTCETCCKTFTQRGSLARHKMMHSGGERRFKCSICPRGFVMKSALQVHERAHLDIRPFKCNLCDRSYREASYLKLHMRIHNQERNYECSQCKVAFHRQSHLQRHMKVHEANRKMYSCDNCDKSYFRRRSITEHMKKFHAANN